MGQKETHCWDSDLVPKSHCSRVDFLAIDKEAIFAFNMFLLFPAFWLIYVAGRGVTKQMCRIQTALPCTMTVNKECDPRAT